MRVAFAFVFLFAAFAFAEKTRYDGHQVLRANVSDHSVVAFLEEIGYDIWAHPLPGVVDIRVAPSEMDLLTKLGLDYKVLIPNVQDLIDAEEREMNMNRSIGAPMQNFFQQYNRYSVIVQYMQNFATQNSGFVTYSTIGNTINGLPIPHWRFQRSANPRGTIFISGGQHAREWIASHVTLYVFTRLVELANSGDSTANNILNAVRFEVTPLANPDGYEFSHTNTRLWRKNRRNNGGNVFGVDMNRNWNDGNWGGGGASHTPSSDTYCGTAPNSEPEVQALANLFTSLRASIYGSIDWHSYSQLILRPYGYTRDNAPNEAALASLGTAMRNAIIATTNYQYTSQKSIDLYVTTGTAEAYYYVTSRKGNAPYTYYYSYTIELRDTGTYGFQLPANQIVPCGNENYAAFVAFCNTVISAMP